MNRREFALGCALLAAAPAALADGAGQVAYTPDAYAAALTSGEPFMLDFFAPW